MSEKKTGLAGWQAAIRQLSAERISANSTQTDELRIGVSNNVQGAHICITQQHADGSATMIYSAEHLCGDSCGTAKINQSAKQSAPALPTDDEVFAEVNRLRDMVSNRYVSREATNDVMQAVRSLLAVPAATTGKSIGRELAGYFAYHDGAWHPSNVDDPCSVKLYRDTVAGGIDGEKGGAA